VAQTEMKKGIGEGYGERGGEEPYSHPRQFFHFERIPDLLYAAAILVRREGGKKAGNEKEVGACSIEHRRNNFHSGGEKSRKKRCKEKPQKKSFVFLGGASRKGAQIAGLIPDWETRARKESKKTQAKGRSRAGDCLRPEIDF